MILVQSYQPQKAKAVVRAHIHTHTHTNTHIHTHATLHAVQASEYTYTCIHASTMLSAKSWD